MMSDSVQSANRHLLTGKAVTGKAGSGSGSRRTVKSARLSSSRSAANPQSTAKGGPDLSQSPPPSSRNEPENIWKSLVKGLAASILAYALFSLAILLLTTLFLLIIGMETHTVLSGSILPIGFSFILLSQGIGLTVSSLNLSLIPLGLTFLFLLLIRSCSRRCGMNLIGFFAGSLAWLLITSILLKNNGFPSLLPLPAALGRSWLVFLVGSAWGSLPGSAAVLNLRAWIKNNISATVRRTIWWGLLLAARFLLFLCALSLLTLLVWVITGISSMKTVISYSSMGPWSVLITCLLSLAWLPNLAVWALSWILGSGFIVGSTGTFTLWESQSDSLPIIPLFGLFPREVPSQTLVLIILIIPILAAFLLGISLLASRRRYNIFSFQGIDDQEKEDSDLALPGILDQEQAEDQEKESVEGQTGRQKDEQNQGWEFLLSKLIDLAYAAASFIVAFVVTVFTSLVFYNLSTGALGKKNLSLVGVSLSDSLNVTGRPLTWGLIAAWLLSLLLVCGRYAYEYVRRRKSINSSDDEVHQVDAGSEG